jgi:hypothetical protein
VVVPAPVLRESINVAVASYIEPKSAFCKGPRRFCQGYEGFELIFALFLNGQS